MNCEETSRNVSRVDAPELHYNTCPGADLRLDTIGLPFSSLPSPKQTNSSDNAFDSLDEAKKLEQYNDLHGEPPIGDATMDDDGTIRVRIRRMGGMDVSGEIEYSKESEHYDSVLKHLGGLKPGEVKLVPPWPDDD